MALLQCIFCPLLPPTSFGSPEQSHSSPLWPPGGMASPPQPPSHSVLGWCISAPTTFLSPSYRPDFRCWEVGEREGSHREKKKNVPHTGAPVHRCSCIQSAISDCTGFFCLLISWTHTPSALHLGARVELWAVQTYVCVCALWLRSDCSRRIPHKILAKFEAALSVRETPLTWSKVEL